MVLKEAMLYTRLLNGNVQCHVCSHRCVIKAGARGICGVRENRDGVLYALNYGQTISASIDPIEKKPLMEFYPQTLSYSFATVGCNMRCAWCQNASIAFSPKKNKAIEGTYVSPERHVQNALKYRCKSIAYTYTEPTIFLEYALDVMRLGKEAGLKNVWVSNGLMSEATLDAIMPYLDAVNIDYKGPDDKVYVKYCGGYHDTVLGNLKRLSASDVHLEVTTLIVPGVNDALSQIKAMIKALVDACGKDVIWHVSRFFPAHEMMDKAPTPVATLKHVKALGEAAGIKTIYLGNI